jgi:hypothetical protein
MLFLFIGFLAARHGNAKRQENNLEQVFFIHVVFGLRKY